LLDGVTGAWVGDECPHAVNLATLNHNDHIELPVNNCAVETVIQ